MQNSASQMHLVIVATSPQLDSYSSNIQIFKHPTITITPTGKTVPHLIVKCGENHVSALAKILSTFLNGDKNNSFPWTTPPFKNGNR